MGTIKKAHPVKLIAGLIFKEEAILQNALALLERYFGKADFQSPALPFIYTDYYQKEMGQGLTRKFVSFKTLIMPQRLAEIKITTDKIEKKFMRARCRLINIDPGYIELSKIVLASTKDFSHRIYLGKGIYADLTLIFKNKNFCPLDWTFPDYRSKEYLAILRQIREIYASEIKI
jgi:hypothetical protein